MATQYAFGKIVTNGLVLALDAADRNSYVSGSTTWFDVSGNTNAILTNGPTFDSGSGGSIFCDGVNDYINLGQTYRYQDQFTVECWVKWPNTPSQGSGTACGVLGPIFTNKDWGWNLQTNVTNTISWNIYSTNSNSASVISPNSYLNQWVHIIGTKNRTTIELYVNGQSQGTSLLGNNSVYYPGTNPCTFGGFHPCGPVTYYFQMYTAVGRIYNRVLSSQEILQNYNAQKSRFGLT